MHKKHEKAKKKKMPTDFDITRGESRCHPEIKYFQPIEVNVAHSDKSGVK